jgi:RNA recognition motif-containing protein
MKIYIENLLYEITKEDLQQTFEPFGQVTSAVVVEDVIGQSKGCGFVEMPVEAEAQAAITGLDGQKLKGRIMAVNEVDRWGKGHQYFEYL